MPNTKMPRPVFFCQCGDHAWTALTRGYVTLVSPEDAHFIEWRAWSTLFTRERCVYARAGGSLYLHRLILEADETDHENRNGTDNRRGNLRPCTRQQNLANRRHRRRKSHFKGAEKFRNRWRARITVFNKNIQLGTFDTAEKAARAYDTAATKYFGEFAELNFSQADG